MTEGDLCASVFILPNHGEVSEQVSEASLVVWVIYPSNPFRLSPHPVGGGEGSAEATAGYLCVQLRCTTDRRNIQQLSVSSVSLAGLFFSLKE